MGWCALAVEELLLVVTVAAGRSGPASLDRGGCAAGIAASVRAYELHGDDLDAHVIETGHTSVAGIALVVDVVHVSKELDRVVPV